MEIPLLHTKLYLPKADPAALVARPRLITRLNEGLTGKLTLVAAPAGFGKTTLIGSWLAQFRISDLEMPQENEIKNLAAAWISLDEGDNDPIRFWVYVTAALQTMQPDLGLKALSLLHAAQAPPLEAVLILLLNDIATFPTDFILVLDDYHVIEEQAIHDSLTFLLGHLPGQMHLVITSRVDPPFPLPRLRVRRQLTELRAEELRFTSEEAAVFLNRVMALNLSAADVAALEARTEGWIAGLQLAAASMRGRDDKTGFIQAFTGSHHFVLDYLAEEVLYQQPAHIQNFLLQTSILDRLTGPLSDVVTGREDGQSVLEQLAQTNLFIVPLDDQRQWFRYHRLFEDLLRQHLLQTPPDGIPVAELHRRAAAWYEQAGLVDEAVKHALAAGDFEQTERLIEQNAQAMFMRGELVFLRGWLEALPPERIRTQPHMSVIYAWLLFFTGELAAAAQRLDEAEQILTADDSSAGKSLPETQQLRPLIVALRAQIALAQGEVGQTIELSRQALAQLPAEAVALKSTVALTLVIAYWLNGDVEAADRTMIELSVSSRAAGDVATILVTTNNLAKMQMIQGNLTQAASLYRRALQLAGEKKDTPLPTFLGRSHVGLGGLLSEWNELAAAAHHFNQGVELGRQGADVQTMMIGYIGLAWVFQAQGEVDQALNTMHQAAQLGLGLGPGFISTMSSIFQARLWVAQGDLIAAGRWVQEYNLSHTDNFDDPREFEYITLARVLIGQGKLGQASPLLIRLRDRAEVAGRRRSLIEILALQSLAQQAEGQTREALIALSQALTLAEPEGYIRIFADEGPPMAALLLKFLEKRPKTDASESPTPDYLQRLLTALGVGDMGSLAEVTKSAQALVEPLTERELEILQLIATGLSNQDIADQLIIALSTVKTHTKNVYGKLGVNSRIQAVTKGTELGLL